MIPETWQGRDIGHGPTEELSLRVSAATLAKVLFVHPQDGQSMLALERTATLHEFEGKQVVRVRAKPFGGGVRLNDPISLQKLIGSFHFDSQRSREEGDFRLYIRPGNWEKVRAFCLQQFQVMGKAELESRPERELLEESWDALKVEISPEQFRVRPIGAMAENVPIRTESVRAAGQPTARVYSVFEVRIIDPSLAAALQASSERYADEDLVALAWEDAGRGGKGRANAILALRYDALIGAYLASTPETRNGPLYVQGHRLESNVLALLEEVETPKYQRFVF